MVLDGQVSNVHCKLEGAAIDTHCRPRCRNAGCLMGEIRRKKFWPQSQASCLISYPTLGIDRTWLIASNVWMKRVIVAPYFAPALISFLVLTACVVPLKPQHFEKAEMIEQQRARHFSACWSEAIEDKKRSQGNPYFGQ